MANIVAGLGWQETNYSWSINNISDLGNVTCGISDPATRARYVCSPWHDTMNAAFLMTAVLLIAGLLTWRLRGAAKTVRAGRTLMLLGATGLGLAGVFPADRNPALHMLAALMVFGCGNAGLVLAARGTAPASLRRTALILGATGLAATALFFKEISLGLGVGGMERIAVFPLLIWCCLAGIHLLTRIRAETTPHADAAHREPVLSADRC